MGARQGSIGTVVGGWGGGQRTPRRMEGGGEGGRTAPPPPTLVVFLQRTTKSTANPGARGGENECEARACSFVNNGSGEHLRGASSTRAKAKAAFASGEDIWPMPECMYTLCLCTNSIYCYLQCILLLLLTVYTLTLLYLQCIVLLTVFPLTLTYSINSYS